VPATVTASKLDLEFETGEVMNSTWIIDDVSTEGVFNLYMDNGDTGEDGYPDTLSGENPFVLQDE
jgi:hypothetical protein